VNKRDWRQTRLKFVAAIDPPLTRLGRLGSEDPVSFVPMEAVGDDGSLDLSRERSFQSVREGYTAFQDGDVVVAKITPCFENGKGALAQGLRRGVGFGTTELFVLRPTPVLDGRFLYYLTYSDSFRQPATAQMYGAGGQKRVPPAFVADFTFGVPPLTEQRAIADFLDRETGKTDRLIDRKQHFDGLLSEGLSGTIEALLSAQKGVEAPLKRRIDLLPGYAFASEQFLHSPENALRLLRGVNVSPSGVRWDDVVWWASVHRAAFAKYELDVGDIVFGMDRPWIGEGARVARLTPADVPSLLLQRVARIRPLPGLLADYLYLILQSGSFKAFFEPELTGVSVPHISPEQIGSYRCVIPSEAEQRGICEAVARAAKSSDQRREALGRSIEILKEYRSALITAAVTGQIEVRQQGGRLT